MRAANIQLNEGVGGENLYENTSRKAHKLKESLEKVFNLEISMANYRV